MFNVFTVILDYERMCLVVMGNGSKLICGMQGGGDCKVYWTVVRNCENYDRV